ncbi:MAG TPA: S8 family serine peptidase, partial [Flavisolibacter sp.]
MKPYLIIKLKEPARFEFIPHWTDFIKDKSHSVEKFNNRIDEVIDQYKLDYWITQEYKPKSGDQFNGDEIQYGLNRIYRLIFKDNIHLPENLVNEISMIPLVEEVRSGAIGQTDLPQPSKAMAFDLMSDRAREIIYLKQAQLFSKGHPDINVAVLDTGVDLEHPELQGVIKKKADFVNIDGLDSSAFIGDTLGFDEIPQDEVGHGTHVSGIIAGKGLRMPEGVAPRCSIMAVRVLATLQQGDKRVGAGLIDNINVGIKWAVDNGADVINMSLGVKHEYGGLPHEEVIKYALGKGVTIVAASGNDGTNDKYYPGALPGVLAIGAVNDTGSIADFSNYGVVTLVAPGTNIYSSFMDRNYAFCSGTSQAAPFVSGGIALLKSFALQNGYRLKDNQVKYLLKHTSDKPDTQFKTTRSGYGKLNLVDALKLLKYQSNYS